MLILSPTTVTIGYKENDILYLYSPFGSGDPERIAGRDFYVLNTGVVVIGDEVSKEIYPPSSYYKLKVVKSGTPIS